MRDSTSLTTGVIGAGVRGRQHARVYASREETTFVGVHDVDWNRAEVTASQTDGDAFGLEELLDRVDAVSIAVPTRHHFDVARTAIERGIHVLVESPLVADPADGRTLIDLAEREGVVLQVGHVDRFNPALAAVMDVVPDMNIVAVEARHLDPSIGREATGSVALDLVIRDVDVVRALVDDEIRSISSARTRGGQYVNATMTYDSGVVAQFTASRLTQRAVRALSITAEECFITIDLTEQDVSVYRHSAQTTDDATDSRERIIERPVVENGDPLERELESFLSTIRDGGEPAVTGTDGLCALELALAIDEGESLSSDVLPPAVGAN